VEAFVGSSLASLTSIGSVFGLSGDVTGFGAFSNGQEDVFDFNNTVGGAYFVLEIEKTNLSDGYGTFRIYPQDENGLAFGPALSALQVVEPSSLAILAFSIGAVAAVRRRSARQIVRMRLRPARS
jgi:hypothetical protein